MTATRRLRSLFSLSALAATLAASTVLLFSAPAEEPQLSVYSLIANYSVPVVQREGQDYVGLLETLEPLGTVSATTEGTQWHLRYNKQPVDFTIGASHARVRQHDFDLHGDFLFENGRGLVPIATLGPLMSRILGGPVTIHAASRRVFVGNVAVHFTAQISKAAPHTLIMNFSAPVNPMVATEPGQLRMVFSHEPVVAPGSPSLTFDDNIIPSANFTEGNGAAEIAVHSDAALFASFSNGNRTITITLAPLQSAHTAAPASGTQAPPATNPNAPGQSPGMGGEAQPAPSKAFVVLDAAHGGSERGEALSDQMAEKDVTLAFALALRQELQNRGIPTLMVRDSDLTLTPDQRAGMTNAAHPAIYVCLHASSQGQGVRLYTSLLPDGGQNSGPFVSWETAQSSSLPASRSAADTLATGLRKQRLAVRVLMAPLRPLNNITTAAVAVEVAPPAGGIADMTSPVYQQQVATGIADGVAALRGQPEAGR